MRALSVFCKLIFIMPTFARTWWGQQWLSAFNGIDDLNRLPRGRRYAANGSVRAIDIGAAAVRAKVQGHRRTPYTVEVALAQFSAEDRRSIFKAVEKSPALLSRLLNRQLPPQMLAILEDRRIRLFPRGWRDMKAHCSCPDWALPCKHIAAVIYLIANEIDKNPFLVFELHGMDLADALQARAGAHPDALLNLPVLSECWCAEPIIGDFEPPPADTFSGIDLSSVPVLEARILTILSAEPLFYPKDFHKILAAQYKRTSREARAFDQAADEEWPEADRLPALAMIINGNGHLVGMRSGEKPLFAEAGEGGTPARLDAFLQRLHALPASLEPRLAHSLILWRTLLRLALKLIEQRAYVPWVLTNSTGQTLIQWRPALLSELVKDLFERVCALCPPDLVVLEHIAGRQAAPRYADAQTQIIAALHLLLGFFIGRAYARSADAHVDDAVKQLFFAGVPIRFERFETAEHPQLIRHWLRRLTLAQRPHRLHLMVAERGETHLAAALHIEREGRLAPLSELLAEPGLSDAKVMVLADLAVLADYFPDAEQLYEPAKAGDELIYSLAAFTPVFRDVLPALRMLGIGIILPKALRNLARPRASLSLSSQGGDQPVSYLNLDRLLQFDWRVAVGDKSVSVAEFRRLVENASGIVRLLDQYVMVDEAELRQLLDKLDGQPEALSPADLLQAGLSGELVGAQVALGDNAQRLFDQLLRPDSPPPRPSGLVADLRPYQQRGFEWLTQNARLGFGSLLADDMGLGKTLQVIATLLHFKEAGQLEEFKALVVVPTSLLTNWRKEIERFAPPLKTHIFHGVDRFLSVAGYDVVLTSYGLARSDARLLGKQRWRVLVLDEAQNIKNPASAQAKAVKRLKAEIRIAMSGTPVENRLREYWSVFDFINPGYLRTQKRFQEEFASPIERDRDQTALARFRTITGPFILRRLKSDKRIIADLPDKVEGNRYCTLTPAQASLYQNTVDIIMDELTISDEGIERRGLIFKLLNALKQICNSPAQFLKHESASIEASGKLSAFMEIMREVEASDEKALIFTQYTTMGELLTVALRDELRLEIPFLHGGLSRNRRDDLVDSFQKDRGVRAMVLSLKAGGTGLNLTAASQVIHYDLWWNPAVERQATDRAYRIGQRRDVMVHRLITENTFEERIDAMIQSKKELAELTVSSGEQWLTELSNEELRDLVSL